MKICNEIEGIEEKYKHPKLIPGHLYKKDSGKFASEIYIYCPLNKQLIALSDGGVWAVPNDDFGWDGYGTYRWEDVTDQYCLKKVK